VSVDAWLVLALASGIRGPVLRKLLDRFGDAKTIVNAASRDLLSAGLTERTVADITHPDSEKLRLCDQWLSAPNNHAVTWVDSRYPILLTEIHDPPPLLFVRGNPDTLCLPQFAIVGSRNATPGGRETAHQFARHLSQGGFCITSGLALGIDAAAHRGALDAGNSTVAVFGTGLDEVYPKRHEALAHEIEIQGALVAEFPPQSPVRRAQFPQRNRIISGMAVGTLVVEAGLRSGALITARLAGEQGREVFAIPGSIHNPMARGCHRLIRSGAKLVEASSDIMEELPAILSSLEQPVKQNIPATSDPAKADIDPEYRHLLTLMGWDPITIDALVKRSGLTAEEVSSMILILELEGRIDSLTGGRYLQREKGRSK
jgi:DNA processing protein